VPCISYYYFCIWHQFSTAILCTHGGPLTCNFVWISLKSNHGYIIGYHYLFSYNLFANALSLFSNGVLGASRVSASMGNTFLGGWGSNSLQAICKLWCLFGLQNLTCFRRTSEMVGTWNSTWFFPKIFICKWVLIYILIMPIFLY
jgi:hypothetical protein